MEPGIWKGSPAANPTFCLPLQQAKKEAADMATKDAGNDQELQQDIAHITKLAYAGDAFFIG